MMALSHVEAVHRIMAGREYTRRAPVTLASHAKLSEREVIDAAVEKIRALRGSPEKCGWPDDLGCYTQLYLALAIRKVRPTIGNVRMAELCRVPITEAHFFAELVELAHGGDWIQPGIVKAAAQIVRQI